MKRGVFLTENTRKRVNIFESKISEKIVAYIWQYQLVTNFSVSTGEKLKVIYPGRVSSDSGGDFKDGVFIIGSDLICGDVEVHVKSSQWYAHGHSRDHKYNGVVLHVVMWQDNQTATILQCGRSIPIVNISSCLSHLHGNLDANTRSMYLHSMTCPEVDKYQDMPTFMQMLKYAGKRRFRDRAMFFNSALQNKRPDEVLFHAIAGAMGYTKNKIQFERLAGIIIDNDFNVFSIQDSITKRAILLGTAGLLPSQRSKANSIKSK